MIIGKNSDRLRPRVWTAIAELGLAVPALIAIPATALLRRRPA
jgi:hypothetical protein